MSADNNPLVSVLMTAYNREKYIAEAIESVLASTYENFELIIVDDCSKDNTVNIAKQYEEKDKRIRVYVNEKNLGDYPNRNNAASYAKGEYLMSVDSDDMIFENGIKMCIGCMLQFPQAKFATYYRIPAKEPFVLDSVTAINNHFFKEPYLMIGPGGTIISRKYFIEIQGFPEKYGPSNDMYYNLKAACNTPVLMLPFEFLFYRRHAGQEINNAYSYLYNNYRYNRDSFDELNLPIDPKSIQWLRKKNKRRFVVNAFRYFIKSRNISKTRNAIKMASFTFRDAMEGIFH